MARFCRYRVPVLLALVATLFAPCLQAATPAGTLEGRWKLVEQHYGKGKSNLADLEAPVMLEFTRDMEGGQARVWAVDGSPYSAAWPAYIGEDGPAPVEVLERIFDPASRRAFSRCRVNPSPGSDLVLLIVEEYTVAAEGDELLGTVTVTFIEGEETRGSYILHRRFERVR